MNKLSEIFILLLAWCTAILGMLCIALGIYLIPYLLNWFHVDFLDHFIMVLPDLDEAQQLESTMAKLGVALPFIIGGGLFWVITYYCSNLLNEHRPDEDLIVNEVNVEVADAIEEQQVETEKSSILGRISPTIKILLAVLAVILLIMFAEYLMSVEFVVFPTN